MVCKLFVCKVCRREWQFYSHFVIKLLILMKTIKKREKPIIAPETELMNCRREEQRVYLISQRRQRINAMAPKLEQKLSRKLTRNSYLQDKGTNYKVPMKNFQFGRRKRELRDQTWSTTAIVI